MSEPLLRPEERFATPVTGAAYRTSAKIAAGTTIASLALYGLRVIDRILAMPWTMSTLIAAAFVGVVVTSWYIFAGRTTVDAHGIRQDWIVPKSYEWSRISKARYLRLPFTSRLMLRAGFGPIKAIQGGTPELDAAFREIAAWYQSQQPKWPKWRS